MSVPGCGALASDRGDEDYLRGLEVYPVLLLMQKIQLFGGV